ncbi:MAG: hypothetical protein HOE88_04455 [Flavobacteriales bacterium]|nr:hypothetical protein [Flavobacteriales bacterium]MBT3573009.1 hypothetical protein [Flavobacteriales bacterium]MBT3677465.1 hypothetical protein [Flavobacteriales bacterium]MBT3739517.1 hypothetical protein [Flavobacteriales bacterium]MBT4102611.1 hypothetical protein [Flavobacteriales bacterium]
MDNSHQQLLRNGATLLQDIHDLLTQLSDTSYAKPIPSLSMASLGEHVRHSLGFYECLLEVADGQVVDYDARKRDPLVETQVSQALTCTGNIQDQWHRLNVNKVVYLKHAHGLESTLSRELLNVSEHTLHHMALMSVALIELGLNHVVNDNFGIAPSTLANRQAIQKN